MSNPKFDNILKQENNEDVPTYVDMFGNSRAPKEGYFDVGFGYLNFFKKRYNRNAAQYHVRRFNNLLFF